MLERKKKRRKTTVLTAVPFMSVPYGTEFALNGWWFTRIFSAGDTRPMVKGSITNPVSHWSGKWTPDSPQRPMLLTSGNYGACVCKFDGTRMRINRGIEVMVKVEVDVV